MTDQSNIADFVERLEGLIRSAQSHASRSDPEQADAVFNQFALDLFRWQHTHNEPLRRWCEARGLTPRDVQHWRDIPAVPTVSFKEFELTVLPDKQRSVAFHSSGTTEQRPSRHFHNRHSLRGYHASLLPWFRQHLLPELVRPGPPPVYCAAGFDCLILTPPPTAAPQSSLVHMLDMVREAFGSGHSGFAGRLAQEGAWELRTAAVMARLRQAADTGRPLVILGTAFNFVNLFEAMDSEQSSLCLPENSRVMETGGYKGRSRELSREALHTLITARLGIPAESIVSEYGMCELSSQAYDHIAGQPEPPTRVFHFPPWARAQVISPETGREVAEGGTGLMRVFDLANLASSVAVQTEDLAARCGDGFELLGRAPLAEPRGCSRMAS